MHLLSVYELLKEQGELIGLAVNSHTAASFIYSDLMRPWIGP